MAVMFALEERGELGFSIGAAKLVQGPRGEPGRTAYEYAVSQGYQGTEEEFATEMAALPEYAAHAAESAETAVEAAADAQSARTAAEAAQSAAESAAENAARETQALLTGYVGQAETAKTAAEASAATAAVSEANAAASVRNAQASAGAAAESAGSAATSAADAGTARSAAEGYATAAAASASTADTRATAAQTAKNDAESAAAAAVVAQTAAESARDTVLDARTAVLAAAESAGTSEENAAASALSAQGSAGAAAVSAGSAAASASEAQTARSGAASSALAASESAAAAVEARQELETARDDAEAASLLARSWAVGNTGSRAGENTNNAQYWAEQAQSVVGGDFATKLEARGYAETAEQNAADYTDQEIGSHDGDASAHQDLRASLANKVNSATFAAHTGNATVHVTQEERAAWNGKEEAGAAAAVQENLESHTDSTDNPHGVTADQTGAIPVDEKGAAGGVATLGADGKVPPTQLPYAGASCVTVTLPGSGWSGNTRTITGISGITGESCGLVAVADSATVEQRNAARAAMLHKTGQGAGSITITADGTKPTVDIPLAVVVL